MAALSSAAVLDAVASLGHGSAEGVKVPRLVRRGRARADLGDTMCDGIGVADLGGRILKWAKTDEKL